MYTYTLGCSIAQALVIRDRGLLGADLFESEFYNANGSNFKQ